MHEDQITRRSSEFIEHKLSILALLYRIWLPFLFFEKKHRLKNRILKLEVWKKNWKLFDFL